MTQINDATLDEGDVPLRPPRRELTNRMGRGCYERRNPANRLKRTGRSLALASADEDAGMDRFL